MAVAMGQVVCPSNADTVIIAAANTVAGSSYGGKSKRYVTLYNPSGQGIYIGTSVETTSTGFLMPSGGPLVTMVLEAGDAIYGRGASSSPTIHYIETGA